MVTKVEMWRADDGTLFDDANAARKHDLVEKIVQDFGVYSHDPVTLRLALTAMLENGYSIIPPPNHANT